MRREPGGKVYYVDHNTKSTHWNPPHTDVDVKPAPSAPVSAPDAAVPVAVKSRNVAFVMKHDPSFASTSKHSLKLGNIMGAKLDDHVVRVVPRHGA